jgi:hypothetical protein
VPPNEPDKPSDRVRQLLLGPVDSFEKLEVLLALHSAAGGPLRLGEVDLATVGLTAAGLIERTAPDAWCIRSESTAGVGELAGAWATCRPAVLKIMTDRALARIRTATARRFADAFRLRRRDQDDGDDDG